MKTSILALLGVGAACAACCAIPLALPLLAGLGLVSLGGAAFGWMAAVSVAGLLAMAALYLWRRHATAQVCATDKSCGCS